MVEGEPVLVGSAVPGWYSAQHGCDASAIEEVDRDRFLYLGRFSLVRSGM